MKFKKLLLCILVIMGILSTMGMTAFSDGENYVAKVGDVSYTDIQDAIIAAAPVWVTTYEGLIEELAKGNANIIMMNDITATATQSSGYGKTGIVVQAGDTLDGNGKTLTINGVRSTWDSVIAMKGGEVKNLTVAGAMRGVFMPGANGNVVIDNCVFKNVIYTFNSDGGSKDYTVTVKNSTLNGWTSFSDVHKSVTFENCTFGEGSGYAFCRPYQPTEFNSCGFDAGFEFDASKPAENSLVFDGCTYNGVALSSDNGSEMFYNGGDIIIDDQEVQFAPDIPTATVAEPLKHTKVRACTYGDWNNVTETPLTFQMNFKADEPRDPQRKYYSKWIADYELTINKDVRGVDGYLAGQYDSFSENWIKLAIDTEDVILNANTPVKIVNSLMGLTLEYEADILDWVKDFDCGIYLTPEFIKANPDLKITLALKLYNPENEEESIVIGKPYEFTAHDAKIFDTLVDGGTYADKTGAIAFNAFYYDYANVASYGMYIYVEKDGANYGVKLDNSENNLTNGWFYAIVNQIPEANKDDVILCKPYIKIGEDYSYADVITAKLSDFTKVLSK